MQLYLKCFEFWKLGDEASTWLGLAWFGLGVIGLLGEEESEETGR